MDPLHVLRINAIQIKLPNYRFRDTIYAQYDRAYLSLGWIEWKWRTLQLLFGAETKGSQYFVALLYVVDKLYDVENIFETGFVLTKKILNTKQNKTKNTQI